MTVASPQMHRRRPRRLKCFVSEIASSRLVAGPQPTAVGQAVVKKGWAPGRLGEATEKRVVNLLLRDCVGNHRRLSVSKPPGSDAKPYRTMPYHAKPGRPCLGLAWRGERARVRARGNGMTVCVSDGAEERQGTPVDGSLREASRDFAMLLHLLHWGGGGHVVFGQSLVGPGRVVGQRTERCPLCPPCTIRLGHPWP